MTKIKLSKLKELFESHGLSEGMFDIFKSKKKKLKKKLSAIDRDIDDVINSAPDKEEKEALRDLADFLADY